MSQTFAVCVLPSYHNGHRDRRTSQHLPQRPARHRFLIDVRSCRIVVSCSASCVPTRDGVGNANRWANQMQCRKCLFRPGCQVVCMACATGFEAESDEDIDGWSIGVTLRLFQSYRLLTQRIDGKIRCKFLTDVHPTDTFVRVVGNGEFVNIFGEEREGWRVATECVPCPFCSETQLLAQANLDEPGRCPHCGQQSLYRTVIL